MYRGPVSVPYDQVDRRTSYLEGAPGLKKVKAFGKAAIFMQNLGSRFSRPAHFESVRDFLDNQAQLIADIDAISFDCSLAVQNIEFDDIQFNLTVADSAGDEADIIHPHYRVIDRELKFGDDPNKKDYYLTFDNHNNPVQGALPGDHLQVYLAQYNHQKPGTISVPKGAEIYVRNDALWQRVQGMRGRTHEVFYSDRQE